ncbi:MAG: OmpA family protein [Candidatus Competibacteraceae bacterium]|nr:OmpA family protein [Candidatus Competibacteraceae bacterium]MCB1805555.1 OmpA family protein [Candidatus Competibacteraceae bacterium]
MKLSRNLFCIGLLAGAFGLAATVQAGPYSYEPAESYPPAPPPTRYNVHPVVWHSPQPLIIHGIPSTLRATPGFAFDRSRLDGAAQAELDGLLHRVHGLNSHYGMGKAGIAQSASVVGHTDSIGSRRYNQRLSIQRAQTTADYLVINGVRPEAISVSGAGESQPVASNRSRAGRAANRRADVTVHALIAP